MTIDRSHLFTRALALISVVLFAFALATPRASAAPVRQHLYAYPGYNAVWTRGAGLADSTEPGRYGLVLDKTDPTVTEEHGAGVAISGVASASELSFDIADVATCGSAPMFRIVTPDGAIHDLACQTGLLTPRSDGWTHVSFDPIVSGYGGLQVSHLYLRIALPQATTGHAVVDNIDVNGTVFGR